MWLFWVLGAGSSAVSAGLGFLAGFLVVAGFAECLEVCGVVCASGGDVFDVVNFEVLCGAAFHALVVVAVEDFLADVAGGTF